ncbi:uncharacterized protein V1516DRAFT_682228 [Lipomyces oligophaga]|uniref:uncharacterized protein n=1 Tax=Lipomyces oligophaga TaxID=45792 RepID=UPI0034CEA0B9
MDSFGISRASIRTTALQRLASFAASHASSEDYSRISRALDAKGLCFTKCRMQNGVNGNGKVNGSSNWKDSVTINTVNEFEVLLALAESAQRITVEETAASLLDQFAAYLRDAYGQHFVSANLLKDTIPSPWDVITNRLTLAILDIAHNFPSLRSFATEHIKVYLDDLQTRISSVDISDLDILWPIAFSILGFFSALSSRSKYFGETGIELITISACTSSSLAEDFPFKIDESLVSLRSLERHGQAFRIWNGYRANYSSLKRPFGGSLIRLAYMEVVHRAAGLHINADKAVSGHDHESYVDSIIGGDRLDRRITDLQKTNLKSFCNAAMSEIEVIDSSEDYQEVLSSRQRGVLFKAKALALEILCIGNMHDLFTSDELIHLIKETLTHESQLMDDSLASEVFRIMACLSRTKPEVGSSLARILPKIIVEYRPSLDTIQTGTRCVAYVLKFLPEDAVISTLYTFANLVVDSKDHSSGLNGSSEKQASSFLRAANADSTINLVSGDEEDRNIIFENIVHALARIVSGYNEPKITSLTILVLIQKIGYVAPFVERAIVISLVNLATVATEKDFNTILTLYSRLTTAAFERGETEMPDAVLDARRRIAKKFEQSHPFYYIYMWNLLDEIIIKGDVRSDGHHRHRNDIRSSAAQISYLIQPLADLLPPIGSPSFQTKDEELLDAFRNAWFNMVVHGYSRESEWVSKYYSELQTIAWNSPALISESISNKFESDMDLNTILNRGSNQGDLNDQRQKALSSFTSGTTGAMEIRLISYPKLIFLSTTLLLESMRASAGSCSKIQLYFMEPGLRSGDSAKIVNGILGEVMSLYLRKVRANKGAVAIEAVSRQLRELLILCCHRIREVSTAAVSSTQRLVETMPSALCRRDSLFTLLELLTLLWNSCLGEDIDQYDPQTVFTSARAKITIELSDSYSLRRSIIRSLNDRATAWIQMVIDISPLDMKGLLQTYLSEMDDFRALGHISFGRSFALEMAGRISYSDNKLVSIQRQQGLEIDTLSDFLTQYTWRQTHRRGYGSQSDDAGDKDYPTIKASIITIKEKLENKKFVSIAELREVLLSVSALIVQSEQYASELVYYVIYIPFKVFTKQSIRLGVSIWLWLLNEAPKLESLIIAEITLGFESTIRRHEGLYSRSHDLVRVMNSKMVYAPSNKEEIMHDARQAVNSFSPHLYVIELLVSHFESSKLQSRHLFEIFERALRNALLNMEEASVHPLVRQYRFNLIQFAFKVLAGAAGLSSQRVTYFKNLVLTAALTWFSSIPLFPFGGNRLQLKSDFRLLLSVYKQVKDLKINSSEKSLFLDVKKELLLQFLSHEVYRISIWLDPLEFVTYRQLKVAIPKKSFEPSIEMLVIAWEIDPFLAVSYAKRFKLPEIDAQLKQLIIADTSRAVPVADALPYLVDGGISEEAIPEIRYLLFWAPSCPTDAINYFMPSYGKNTLMMQYAMRSLESHPVEVTFFYVPQIVQMLRHDGHGYIEQYILETAKLDQLFAHQIIWNMKSNAYKDEESTIPDPIKESLDAVMDKMITSFAGQDREFYEREFSFFNEVTSISGKLKPYIKKTKAEKKQKIDEEMAKIKVDVGVYLPSNPDGTVIGIDRKSGRPLQSHAKAPFMATFQIRKSIKTLNTVATEEDGETETVEVNTVEKWLGAIFKVGDDCRQDLLALQLIALFRNIFSESGLDLYLFPYRVIATAPGCGVIDVLPNSISRDMLGREAVNGLYEYFISKHGSEDSIEFQRVRNNFVQSLAAYSVVSFLLQFKDRHNGNIMYDDQGHILHIDFGFCFDIVPGGVKFEAAPFKLTHEMVQVMGGNDTQAYRWFEELCVKAYLACRPYAEDIIRCVVPMLESGLPCFKGETTIRKLRERFTLEKSDKEAAVYMRSLIKKSAESIYTRGYDEFQRMTNGIPY